MKKKHLICKFIASLLLISIVYLLWPSASVSIDPHKKQELDLTLTQNLFYIDENNYDTSMKEVVNPYISQYATAGYITTPDAANLYYSQYIQDHSIGHIVISHGFTESIPKYAETIYYFLKAGYNVSILEHRGHGYSQRFVDDPSKVSIDDFDTYIEDFKIFMDTVVTPSLITQPCYLYAHSMGGGIGARFLETYATYFDAAVLSAPMLEVNTNGIPTRLAYVVAKIANRIGLGENYVFGHGPYDGIFNFEDCATSSEIRGNYLFSLKDNDPNLRTNGATFSWLECALSGSRLASINSACIEIPILLFQAGEDTLVMDNGQNIFVNNAPNAKLIRVENARHELYCSTQEIMVPYFNTIFSFYNSVAEASS